MADNINDGTNGGSRRRDIPFRKLFKFSGGDANVTSNALVDSMITLGMISGDLYPHPQLLAGADPKPGVLTLDGTVSITQLKEHARMLTANSRLYSSIELIEVGFESKDQYMAALDLVHALLNLGFGAKINFKNQLDETGVNVECRLEFTQEEGGVFELFASDQVPAHIHKFLEEALGTAEQYDLEDVTPITWRQTLIPKSQTISIATATADAAAPVSEADTADAAANTDAAAAAAVPAFETEGGGGTSTAEDSTVGEICSTCE